MNQYQSMTDRDLYKALAVARGLISSGKAPNRGYSTQAEIKKELRRRGLSDKLRPGIYGN
jgi:hypothetical protein